MAHLKTDLFRHIDAVLTPADELPARYGQVGHDPFICGLHQALLFLGFYMPVQTCCICHTVFQVFWLRL